MLRMCKENGYEDQTTGQISYNMAVHLFVDHKKNSLGLVSILTFVDEELCRLGVSLPHGVV